MTSHYKNTAMTKTWMTWCLALLAAAVITANPAHAGVGLAELPGQQGDGPVTVFYPAQEADQPVQRGPFALQLAWQGTPVAGNGRLVVVSHGSGGNPWVHSDLARALVQAGFVVALPEHAGDNATVAVVPFAADFDMGSLATPRIALGMSCITLAGRW